MEKEEEENEGFFSKGLREISVDVPYKVYRKMIPHIAVCQENTNQRLNIIL